VCNRSVLIGSASHDLFISGSHFLECVTGQAYLIVVLHMMIFPVRLFRPSFPRAMKVETDLNTLYHDLAIDLIVARDYISWRLCFP